MRSQNCICFWLLHSYRVHEFIYRLSLLTRFGYLNQSSLCKSLLPYKIKERCAIPVCICYFSSVTTFQNGNTCPRFTYLSKIVITQISFSNNVSKHSNITPLRNERLDRWRSFIEDKLGTWTCNGNRSCSLLYNSIRKNIWVRLYVN